MPVEYWFIGPDDTETCDTPDGGCDGAVNGNPYTEDTVPEPGQYACGPHCRHMVQLQGDEADIPDDLPLITWSADLGFAEAALDEDLTGQEDAPATEETPVTFADGTDTGLVTADLADTGILATLVADEGLDIDRLAAEGAIDADTVAAVRADIAATAPVDLADLLANADISTIASALEDPDTLTAAVQMGQDGLTDPQAAFALRDGLNEFDRSQAYVVQLRNDDKWYVVHA